MEKLINVHIKKVLLLTSVTKTGSFRYSRLANCGDDAVRSRDSLALPVLAFM
ncbi:hypothetical protein [Treponema bryantii]|uniref:hypothetical protein n=1 Tax=Treponema bryantii TaxID=163 RepID=UPI00041F3D32|nr:hypothetical protein [Treponema bryantii]